MTEHQMEENQADTTQELNHIRSARREKLARIKEMGINPFPNNYQRTHSVTKLLAQFEQLSQTGETVRIAGRIMSIRLMGKAAFAHIQDEEMRVQIYVKKNDVAEATWELFRLMDIGDIVGVSGSVFVTHTGENSVKTVELTMLAKNLEPLPSVKETETEAFNKWSDPEEKYRHRTVDLIVNRDSRTVFITRSIMVRAIRSYLDNLDFVEVETPVLQPLYGGAAARPFVTKHNSLDRTLYLRIADELYLKRLIAGGITRVYEISKDFRNEGIDRMHSPEFTMMECYAAYEDYTFCMDLMEQLIPKLAKDVLQKESIVWDGVEISLVPPYRRVSMAELVKEYSGIEIIDREKSELANEIRKAGVAVDPKWGVGKMIDELFSEKVEPNLINPTFVTDYPVELSPLAKRHRDNPSLVERFELYIGGLECANSFSELNDPIDQRQRFEEQQRLRNDGDDEAHPIDEDFLEALEVGMPPTAGLGVGIDRLVMILTGVGSLRDVILFPALRDRK